MTLPRQSPAHGSYDVVIVGGAMLGSSVAWWLSGMDAFTGRILVVERDPTYEFAATTHTNSCIRQQFSDPVNIKVSQFGADFVKNFGRYSDDPDAPAGLRLQSFGYLYLACSESAVAALKEVQQIQAAHGAGTRFLTPEEIAAEYPFYNVEDILGANHNTVDEGYFDGASLFELWKRQNRRRGVEYIGNEVTAIGRTGGRIESVTLASGETVSCGTLVNASGTRGAKTAEMAGLPGLPVEPRKRFTFIFSAEKPLGRDLPLTIDPSGVHVRTDGAFYMAGCKPHNDTPPDFDDFTMDHEIWEDHVWPILAHRIPAFEAIRLRQTWVGHYDYNTLDQNAVLGPHPDVANFLYVNGFSGHGLQQSPAMGRGLAEWIVHGEYRSLDLSGFGYARIAEGRPMLEKAII
ncbi:NAD(P)/FAD-dependent oxidoreductase [Oceaniglobus roseus]|uniref:NAD(P)/FAD-dependent oxidoreductase n=1 Tax=Oceaniglobus roseus TaxID=1737570 RepID=UPI000C7ED138|nr:FAD-binding oxidoreductase [Kandeliimicrobium roseum]